VNLTKGGGVRGCSKEKNYQETGRNQANTSTHAANAHLSPSSKVHYKERGLKDLTQLGESQPFPRIT